jgi:mono/diheme cytochrome c family protein
MAMRRVFWGIVLGLAALALVVWLLNFWGDDTIHDAPPLTPASGEQVARGAYLARAGNCMTCHTARGGAPFAGGRPIETPFGTVYASNLTPDSATGLGDWSAGHFWRALHQGRSRDGRLLYPAFPYNHYTKVVRSDADALFAYLRSLQPVRQPNREHELRWPYNTQAALAVWRALYFRSGSYDNDPQRTPQWNRGAYLVQGLGHCGACHTTRNALGASGNLLDLSGGLIPMQNWYAPSLASSSEASVREWPLDEVVQLLQTGKAPRATVMGPMAQVVLHSTQYLEPADLRAMAAYLKTLPPAPGSGESDPREVPQAFSTVLERGGKLYGDHCATCHGERGEGKKDAFPALAGNRAVTLPVTANLVQVVLYGGYAPATRGHPRPFGMPPFALKLSDGEVAAVLTYIRGSWGNKAAPVSELTVNQQRSSTR